MMFKKNTFNLFAVLGVLLLAFALVFGQFSAKAATNTATPTACPYVSGYVRLGSTSGAGLAGVKVTGVSTTDSTVGTGTSDSSGMFGLSGCGRTGMILTPVLSGYTFAPATATYTGSGQIIFVATATANTPTRTPIAGTATPTATPTSLTGAYPDLVIYSVASSPPGWTGGCAVVLTSGIRVTVMNSGTVDAGPFVVDVSGTQQTVSAGLAAGATLNLWFIRTGSLAITVDITNMVVESNEGNNTRSYVTITGTPPVLCTVTPTATFGSPPPVTVTRTPTKTITVTRTRTPTVGISLTPTRTPTTGLMTATPTLTAVFGVCSPVTLTITAPFTFDGAGNFCWQSTNLGTYVNSWNVDSLKINGIEYKNQFITSDMWPAKINGYWYVSVVSSASFAHIEFK